MLNKDFLKLILTNQKKLLPFNEVKHVTVPKFDELSVHNIFKFFKNDESFMQYLPDYLPKGRQFSREYFFNILNTLYPEYVKELIQNSNNQRYSATNQNPDGEGIVIADDWWELLHKNPYVSCKYILEF